MADLPNYQYYLQQSPIIVSQKDSAQEAESAARIDAIKSLVREAAQRNAIRARLTEIDNIVHSANNVRKLDTIYNFQPLMINTVVVPPVIIQANNISDVQNPRLLSVLGVRYEIKENARFSHTPPNWRDSLQFNVKSYDVGLDTLPTELKPKSAAEHRAFKAAMEQGIEDGVKEADSIFKYQLNRLNQTYKGMITFHRFVLDGKITMPAISRKDIALSGNGNTLMLNQSNFEITQLPSFVNNTKLWNSRILSIRERSAVKAPAVTLATPTETPVAIEPQ
ncbi:type IV secretion system DotC family protein [Acinetobacter baumannii]|nr:type IV secretion system DotC family protein [Acinetobacter baumannii]